MREYYTTPINENYEEFLMAWENIFYITLMKFAVAYIVWFQIYK